MARALPCKLGGSRLGAPGPQNKNCSMRSPSPAFFDWLQAFGLEGYAEVFAREAIDFASVHLLSDDDLKALGMTLGHRRILLRAVEQLQGTAAARAPVPAGGGEGEQRQITVLFCDLVGSSVLARQLDPEDLRSLIHTYYSLCCRVIEESGGFVARVIGDGILAYFGYPQAREDAAECAVRAGLRILEWVGREEVKGLGRIQVRIGLATGLSVVSDMVGVGFSELHAVTGATPNLASRIQSMVEPGTLGVSEETRRIAGGFFVYADLGPHHFNGFDQPVRVWRVVGESRASDRFDAQHAVVVDCLGRDAEMARLREVWDQVRTGRCRIVTVVGEAGIGKSRLLRAARDGFAPRPGATLFLQCAPNQRSTPFHPLLDWLRRDIGLDAAEPHLHRVRLDAWLGDAASALDRFLMADFLSLSIDAISGDLKPSLPPDRKRQLTWALLNRHIERLCRRAPTLLVVEDAHWMDGATRDFLSLLFEQQQDLPLMALVTQRPEMTPVWAGHLAATELTLEPLARGAAERLVHESCRGRTLPAPLVAEILDRTDGVPLFIEELTATIVESGLLPDASDAQPKSGALPALDIPSTLRDSLMARLDRMNDVKDVARIASALGREFSYTLLAQVSEKPAQQLVQALDRLVGARLLFQRGVPPQADYQFKHALVQQTAYESQLRSDRQALHARIVNTLETHRPELARDQPGLMAHHCELAGLTDREVDYLLAAGRESTRVLAIAQALSYYERADAAMARLEPTARNVRRHIDIVLGLMEVGRFAILPSRLRALSERARQMAQREGVTGDDAMTAAILFQDGRANVYTSRYEAARSIFHEIRRLGAAQQSTAIAMKPASAYAMGLCCQGLFSELLEFLHGANIGYYKQISAIDHIAGLGWIGYASCQTGSVTEGLRLAHQSVQEAELLQSPIYMAGAYIWRSHAWMAVRRFDEAVADARRCVSLSTVHAVPYLGWHGLVFLALCQCRSGDTEAATASLAQAQALLARLDDGQWSLLDYLPAIEAEIAWARGEAARADELADQALAIALPIGGHFTAGMAWRVKALSALRLGGDVDGAQALFDRAAACHAAGQAQAEACFSAWVWAEALREAGHAQPSRRWADTALSLAEQLGFDLRGCEFGPARAAQVLAA